nr:hypothetical protein [uncultured Mediterranean phage uvMED]
MASPNEERARDIAARGGQEQYEFDKFKAMTGRSDTNPYGDDGMFGSRADYSRTMSPRAIDQINRMAFEQAQGLISGEGYQGRGMDSPQPGYAPALGIGDYIPGGTVQRATPRGTGLGSFFKDGGFLGAFLSDIGGKAPRRFAPNPPAAPYSPDGEALGAVMYNSVPNPAAVSAARQAPQPYNAAEMLQNNMPIANPIRETGGSIGDNVSPMEAIANPGGQAFPDPAADMVDMTLPTPRPTNVSNLLDLRNRAQQTTDLVDSALSNVGQTLDKDYSPSPAAITRENIMDAILASQVRDRNAQNIQNLVSEAARQSEQRSAIEGLLEAESLLQNNNPLGDPIASFPEVSDQIDDFDMLTLGTEAAKPSTSGGMLEINNPLGDPLISVGPPLSSKSYAPNNFDSLLGQQVGDPLPFIPAPTTTVTPTSVSREATIGDERARLMGENRRVQEIENQLVAQGVDRAEARMRANRAVYAFGDATPRTSMAIGRGADPMAAAFEAGLPPLR